MPTGVLQVVYLMLESREAEQAVILCKWVTGAAQHRLLLSFLKTTTHAAQEENCRSLSLALCLWEDVLHPLVIKAEKQLCSPRATPAHSQRLPTPSWSLAGKQQQKKHTTLAEREREEQRNRGTEGGRERENQTHRRRERKRCQATL